VTRKYGVESKTTVTLFDPASFFKSNGEEEKKDAGGEAKASDGASVTATTGNQEHVLVTLPSRESHQSLDDRLLDEHN